MCMCGDLLVSFCSLSESLLFVSILFFFFFQAEDGIRDYKVTGVQTCALPISAACRGPARYDARLVGRSRIDAAAAGRWRDPEHVLGPRADGRDERRSEEHTSELQSPCNLVCRLLLEKKKNKTDLILNTRAEHHECHED